MKKVEVYQKRYLGKKVNEYYNLISNIRKDSFTESNETENNSRGNVWGERGYISFDGDFLVRVSKNHVNQYKKIISIAKLTIEKIGPNVNKESQIEKMLLEKGFEKITDKK